MKSTRKDPEKKSLKVKTKIKAVAITCNHNQKVVRDQAKKKALKAKTNVRAGTARGDSVSLIGFGSFEIRRR